MAALCCYFLTGVMNEKWTLIVLILDHCHTKTQFCERCISNTMALTALNVNHEILLSRKGQRYWSLWNKNSICYYKSVYWKLSGNLLPRGSEM